MNYLGLIHKDRKSDYGVSFPDFPGVITAGKDLDDARAMAEEALALHIEGMLEDGDPIPQPSSLEDVMAKPANKDGVVIVVAAATAAAKRVNVTLPEDVLSQIDRYAGKHGLSRSGFLAQAAKGAIEGDLGDLVSRLRSIAPQGMVRSGKHTRRMPLPLEIAASDTAERLTSPERIVGYLNAAIATGDADVIELALDVAAQAIERRRLTAKKSIGSILEEARRLK